MIKYKILNVSKDSKPDSHVVYVGLYDDKDPEKILTKLPVPYTTQEAFEEALEAKTSKYMASVTSIDDVRTLAQQSIVKVESKNADAINAEVIK